MDHQQTRNEVFFEGTPDFFHEVYITDFAESAQAFFAGGCL